MEETILDILLDDENDEPIVLVDGEGNEVQFEQVAVIPYNDRLYCILKPIDEVEGVEDDEAIVFVIDDDDEENPTLTVESDEKTANAVFDKYYKLLEEDDE